MKRLVTSFLVFAALTVTPLVAWAQTGTTGTGATTQAIPPGLVVKRDGKQLKNEPLVYVTKAHCDDNLEYEFSVRYTASVPVTEIWVGVGNEDCSSVASRQRTTVSSTPVCKLVGRATSSLNPKIVVNAIELFSGGEGSIGDDQDTDAGTDGELDAGVAEDADTASDAEFDQDVVVEEVPGTGSTGCDSVKDLKYKVYFIPLPQPTNLAASKAYEPLAAAGYGYSTLIATFTLFTQLPDAPSDVSATGGESELNVRFDPLSGAPPLTEYKAYFDWGSAEGVACGSGALQGGVEPPPEDEFVTSVSARSGRAKLTGLDEKDIPLGSLVATSVVTVDPAGNESLLTTPICVERIETEGFIDRCKDDDDCKLESCSLRPATRNGGLLGLSALLGLAVALFVRRRHV